MLSQLVASTVVIAIAATLAARYARLNAHYDHTREGIASDRSFRVTYVTVILVTLIATVGCIWSSNPVYLPLYRNDVLRWAGLVVSAGGLAGFEWSRSTLGAEYSPCFDLRVPRRIIRTGPYRWTHHPMYLTNMLILAGAFFTSGSAWILLAALVVGVYYYRSALREDALRMRPDLHPSNGACPETSLD